jgi:hypothetical protein
MKKLKKLIKELRMAKIEIFQALAYIGTVAWYGIVLGIIADAGVGAFPTALLFIGGLVLGFFTLIGLHEAFLEDDE